MEKLLTDQ